MDPYSENEKRRWNRRPFIRKKILAKNGTAIYSYYCFAHIMRVVWLGGASSRASLNRAIWIHGDAFVLPLQQLRQSGVLAATHRASSRATRLARIVADFYPHSG
jgi:hypothetical protein